MKLRMSVLFWLSMQNEKITIERGFVDVQNFGEHDKYNRQALITLYGLWPRNSSGLREKVSNENGEAYRRELESYCKENSVRFITYDINEGTFIFLVNNFDNAPFEIP